MSSNLVYRFIDLFSASKSKYRDHIVPFPNDSQIIISPATHGEIVGFYTSNSFYEHEAARMVASAQRLGLPVHTTAVDSTGSWVRNAALKPTFLLEARRNHRGPLLYVDVDAVFHRDPWPALATYNCDLAVYREADRLISATILLHDTAATLRLLEVWKERCDQDPDIWDQVVLQEILDDDRASDSPQYQVGELPSSFCWIFDRLSNATADAVYIEQLQASRQATAHEKRGRNKRLERRKERIATIETILAPLMDAKTNERPKL
ncbi:glycosyltransferase family 77 protein [Rhizobium sp. 3T7]|uniref:putative nucleotide-diphospho-sugar transferase n=1 Tax=Rhizobium sp. 3T7 TaxID=2874922 RepID=UPI001CCCEE82|nr:putative nucleotide-diphospho-sugar transferase [Rhizobium sp. 3T7]MBZ9789072.1 glycosyltransferase family 77 protein [Rhizobium sp. 3T7]